MGEATPSDADPNSVKCPNHLNEKENVSTGHEKDDRDLSPSTPPSEIQKDEDKADSLTEINENCAGTTIEPSNPYENGKELTASSNCKDKGESLFFARMTPQDTIPASISHSGADPLTEPNIGFPSVSTKLRSKRGSRDPESPAKHETKFPGLKKSAFSSNANSNLNKQCTVVVEDDSNTKVISNQGENGSEEIDTKVKQNSSSHDSREPPSRSDRLFKTVYRRTRSHRAVTNLGDGSSGLGESTSNGSNSNCNAAVDFINGTNEAVHTNGSLELEPTTYDPNNEQNNLEGQQGHAYFKDRSPWSISTNRGQLTEEEKGSSSKFNVGLRSTRSRRSSYNICETTPVNKRKSLQSANKGSWLLLSTQEEGCRYIPQLGDEVVYLRQGHQEYIDFSHKRESGPWTSLKGHVRAVEYCIVESLEYSHVPGSGDSCCKMTLQFVDPDSSVAGKYFKLTLPDLTSFPDFLVERTRFDAAMQRNWTRRDKCKVWWKNEEDSSGNWWDGRILNEKAKSSEFPESPWERYTIQYKSDLAKTQLHSPWELFDANTQWEQPHIDYNRRNMLLSALTKLQQSCNTAQDRYGVRELKKISNTSKFTNRFPVPVSIDLIQSRLENNYYRSFEALKLDVSVLLSNATSFLEKDAKLLAKIKHLSEWFTRTLSSL